MYSIPRRRQHLCCREKYRKLRRVRYAWNASTVQEHCPAYTRSASAVFKVTARTNGLDPWQSVRCATRNLRFRRTVLMAYHLVSPCRNSSTLYLLPGVSRVKFVPQTSISFPRLSYSSTAVRNCAKDAACFTRTCQEDLMMPDMMQLLGKKSRNWILKVHSFILCSSSVNLKFD